MIMKVLYTISIIALLFYGCEQGPPGPQGRDGYNGVDGLDGEESFVFEYELDFTAPEYEVLLQLPNDFNMLDSDVMLAYLLWEITDDGTEIWRPVPQTLFINNEILTYNFDFTKYDASIFLDGTTNLNNLGAAYTDSWIARLVVVPGQFTGRTVIDFSDYNQVKSYYELPDTHLAINSYQKRPD